jgi:predicted AlkP superfamily pyrophosphatase or phosphodiesterase
MSRRSLLGLAALALAAAAVPAQAEPVLMISIDGLRPLDVIEAEKRGLKLPNLTRFLREGSYATGVRGVLPTVTYPSHATLITGVSPARHGIVGNTTFDPLLINRDGWFWYASDYKAQTLWQAARRGGVKVGNIHWPVSVGAEGITWNLPQIWRTGHGDDAKLLTALASPGLVAALERETGETYPQGIDESIEADEGRGRFAVQLIARRKPGFVTVYFAALDHHEHESGAGSAAAHAALERLDAVVGKLVAAQFKAHRNGVVVVVSDHGFEPVSRQTSLFRAFIDAGLIELDAAGKIRTWQAMPWTEGGAVAVVLARKNDATLAARVRSVLEELKANPESGIERIADREAVAALGGNPEASFYLNFHPGWSAADFGAGAGRLFEPTTIRGTHGYFPLTPSLHSTFMVMGKGVAKGKALGEIDMRAIAPTVARILKVKFEGAEAPPLDY